LARPRTRNPKGSGDKLRAELLAAANEVLDRTGDPASVTIRGVAAAVGVAPNAVYLHFADRDALMRELAADRFAAFGDHIRAAMVDPPDDPVERLRRGHAAYVDFALTHAGHYRLLFGGTQHDDRTLELGLAAFELLVEGCRAIIDAGVVGEVDPYDLAASVWAFEHGYVELVRTGVGDLPGPVEALDALLAAMMRP
jgi:AcrR family transcriptional regulator